jgi:EAL domain-containing protein (putative c-di-GMP-specific phosphodiesterase class I)
VLETKNDVAGSLIKTIKNHNPSKHLMAITVLHIANMHIVHDIMGGEFVEKLQIILFEDLRRILDKNDTIEPVNAHTFLIIHKIENSNDFINMISDLFLNFRKHEMIKATPVSLSYKCGSALINDQGIHNAYNKASLAFIECMNKDHFKHLFFEELNATTREFKNNMQLASHFQDAILENRLQLAYQPVINGKNGKIESYECLLRIINRDGNILSAGPHIEIAEKMGFIDAVDEIVLEMVAAELTTSSNIFLGMNISSTSIDNNKWLQKAGNLLNNPQIAKRLVIEITETSAQRDLKKLQYFVNFVHELGARVAIDDFGAGYTSFKQLQHLKADVIKIDGLFIRDIVTNHDNRFFVQMMLDCAKTYNMITVAEFVENSEIAKILIGLDVDLMQGNYFSPAVNYRPWIKDDIIANDQI